MNEPTIRLPHSSEVIKRCKWLIRHYVKCDAYVEYDWLGAPDPGKHNIITCRQRKPINGIMRAHAPGEFWSHWLGQCLSGELREIQPDLDLVDGTDSKKVERGFDAVFELVSQMAAIRRVGDAAPTKALHLLRPRFIAISDKYVREILCIREEFPDPDKGKRYAKRAICVQRAIRCLGRENSVALEELHAYANKCAKEHMCDLLKVTGVAAPKRRVELSKARVLDILLWSHATIKRLKCKLTCAAVETPEPQ